jgi:hypothetical protein
VEIERTLNNAQGGAAISNIADAFDVDREKTGTAVKAMLQELALRVERNALSRGGLADIVALLGNAEAGRALADPQNLSSPEITEAGNGVLDVLIGNKHISRGIAHKAAKQCGLDEATLKKMLPVVASMMMGGLHKETQAIFSERLRDMPGLGGMANTVRSGSPLPMPGEVPMDQGNTGGWGNDLPRPSGGSGGGMGGTVGGGSPLPIPGDNIPGVGKRNRYDDLGDVVRRGGTSAPGGGSLEALIRSILGGLLGFQNRGILGTLLQLFLVRILPAILRRMFSRA